MANATAVFEYPDNSVVGRAAIRVGDHHGIVAVLVGAVHRHIRIERHPILIPFVVENAIIRHQGGDRDESGVVAKTGRVRSSGRDIGRGQWVNRELARATAAVYIGDRDGISTSWDIDVRVVS